MNSPWIKATLIISLGLNSMIAGAFLYRVAGGRPLPYFFGGSPPAWRNPLLQDLPPGAVAAHERLRDMMRSRRQHVSALKRDLVTSLAAPEPDRARIDDQLAAINKEQAAMERMTVEQMLQDIQSLPAEKRSAFVESLQRRMHCGKGCGPGIGGGPEGHGGWKARRGPQE